MDRKPNVSAYKSVDSQWLMLRATDYDDFIEYTTPRSHKVLPRFHNYRTSKIPTNIFMPISLTVEYIYFQSFAPVKFSVRLYRTNLSPLIEV